MVVERRGCEILAGWRVVETGVYCLDAAEGGMLQSGREGPGPGLGVEQDWTELN